MPVFLIRSFKSDNFRVMDYVGEAFDSIGAREITEGRWLISGTPEEALMTHTRIRTQLPRDIGAMVEVRKCDLVDQGLLTDDEINYYRSLAGD